MLVEHFRDTVIIKKNSYKKKQTSRKSFFKDKERTVTS